MSSKQEDKSGIQVTTNVLLAGCVVLLCVVIGLMAYRHFNSPKLPDGGGIGETSEDSYVEQVQVHLERQEYDAGIAKAEEGLRSYPESQKLAELKQECEVGKASLGDVQRILDDAYVFEKEDDFDEALSVIEDGLETYSASDELKEKRREYQKHADEIADYIASAANKDSNNEARDEIQRGLGEYPRSKKLQDELDKYPVGPEVPGGGGTKPQPIPFRWYGTYEGTFRRNDGSEYTVDRNTMLVLDENYIDGFVEGTFYVDQNSDHEDTFRVEGTYDSSTRTLEIWWTEWIVNSGTISRRRFVGTLTEDLQYMDGETTTTEGDHWSNWDSYAE
ncbi:MAG: hypothetical protein IKG22_09740 [Atopobiaceae bacterium]|nr:hypothetical protein [Atopobiaceae bacterium]